MKVLRIRFCSHSDCITTFENHVSEDESVLRDIAEKIADSSEWVDYSIKELESTLVSTEWQENY